MDNETGSELRSVKRELRNVNSQLSELQWYMKTLFVLYILLPVLIGLGGGFYYFNGVGFVKRTYQQYVRGQIEDQTNSETRGTPEENGKEDQKEQTEEAMEEATSDTKNKNNESGWNPGGKETEQAKRRRKGFQEKTPDTAD